MMRVLYLLMFCIFFPGVAMSAQKCINFGDLSGFLDSYVADSGDVDWLLAWPHITIRGIGVCAETVGEYGDVAASIKYDDNFYDGNQNSNTYCWCRMLSPAVSSWVAYGSVYDEAEMCLERCAAFCADQLSGMADSDVFRSNMLGALSN